MLDKKEIERTVNEDADFLDNEYYEEVNDLKQEVAKQKTEKIIPAVTTDKNNMINIQFINDRTENFLLMDAPDMPKLLSITDGVNHKAFMPRSIVGMLVGAGGIGKTHWLTQLALSIASGTNFLERYIVAKAENVFLGLGENSDEDMHRLLRKTAKNLNFSNDLLTKAGSRLATVSFSGKNASFIHDKKPSLFYKNFLNALKHQEPDDGWSLIILDPASRFLGADAENDNAAATEFIALLEALILELKGKPTVLLGHHMSKSNVGNTDTNQNASRGSSALTDGARWQANLELVEKKPADNNDRYEHNQIKFKVVKSNFTAIPDAHILRKNEVGLLGCNEQYNNSKKILSAKDLKK